MSSADIFWLVVPSLLIWLLGWMVSAARNVKIAALEAQLQRALIERISSQEELRAYCETLPARRLWLYGSSPSEKALESIRTGMILTVAGVGLIGWAIFDSRVPLGIGLMTAALGVGHHGAGAMTRHLARRWGLPDRDARPGDVNAG